MTSKSFLPTLLAITLATSTLAQTPQASPVDNPALHGDHSAYGPDSAQQPGVPTGKLSEKLVHTSKIYDGMKSDYWIYVPAQYDPKVPAALMVFQDGSGYISRDKGWRALNVIDNLIAQKKIPVMIAIFINPGLIDDSPGTPTFDTVKAYSDKWHRTM